MGGRGVPERGAIFEIGLERGAQKNEIVSERGALMPKKQKRLERGAKLWVGALSDNSKRVGARSGEFEKDRSAESFLPLPPNI